MSAAVAPEAVQSWWDANQRDLIGHLDRVRGLLEGDADAASSAAAVPDERYALGRLVAAFGLTPFERDIVVLCAGVELEGRFAALVAEATGTAAPTFGLALATLVAPHWSAVTPDGPIRSWRLVRLSGPGVVSAPLRIDERVLHALAGIDELDVRLAGIASRGLSVDPLPPRLTTVADRLALVLADRAPATTVQLVGQDAAARRSVVAESLSARAGQIVLISSRDVPDRADDRFELARLLDREAIIGLGQVVVECADSRSDAARVADLVRRMVSRPIVSSDQAIPELRADGTRIEVHSAVIDERIATWRDALGPLVDHLDGSLAAVATQFMLERDAIRDVAHQVRLEDEPGSEPPDRAVALWEAARTASRPRMDGLAVRLDPVASWDDIVLPDSQVATLHAIAGQVRQRHRVYEEWGFSQKTRRGLGISALFAGSSGTGKTMAAEVIANELRLDLYQIDLAALVSKYIGETEKNLQRLFNAAEGTGAILLFDEADAVFGRRSEVRDSHDRYANIEISYLLQRIETYHGLAILTTNQKQAIDPAFLRRIRFIVHFPFPDANQREAIWNRVFPTSTPTRELNSRHLAQLSIAGGHIRNVAMAGAFIAADRGEPIRMDHLAEAARTEYAKLEQPLSDAELRGWA